MTAGFLPVLKVPGPSSHTVVQAVRRRLGERAGHLGTLDPAAAGVLVVAVGRATRLAPYLAGLEKTYRAAVLFGIGTSTGDLDGAVTDRADASTLTEEAVRRAAAPLVGEITQRPPPASAVKVGGEPLYRAFRRGEAVTAPERRVTVRSADLVSFTPGRTAEAVFDFAVSKGTYIRSLAVSMGEAAGVPASVGALLRTGVGPYGIEESLTVEELSGPTDLLDPRTAFAGWEVRELDAPDARRVVHGGDVDAGAVAFGTSLGVWDGRLVAVGRREGDRWRPKTVLLGPEDGVM